MFQRIQGLPLQLLLAWYCLRSQKARRSARAVSCEALPDAAVGFLRLGKRRPVPMMSPLQIVLRGVIAAAVVIAAFCTGWRFDSDIKAARTRAAQGSVVVATRCGSIEYQQAGTGTPLLMVHGSGDGHDQGMACGHVGTAWHSGDCHVALWLPAHADAS